ncbi:AI-2E family transporter [Marinicella sp. S1101]|uniref:AI-2E family transporter n=1 Tax=Marinicella marina TaxID=2996016 RepID=UPI002260E6C1|nr:AI-2E family transporter [Marinicella marina]MCX7554994.1 AI-2E family transporter [Marinicella marina]MDJ1141342.1 AI-2E family transporter [Marinicella marina]
MTNQINKQWYILALVILTGYLVYLLSPILTPFAVGALLAYLFDPLADKLEAWKMSRSLAVAVVFLVITIIVIGIALLLVPALERQISSFIKNLPLYFEWLRNNINPWLQSTFGIQTNFFDMSELTQLIKSHWESAGGIAQSVLSSVTKSGLVIVNWFMNFLLIPVVTFYLLRDWDIITERVSQLVPRPYYNRVSNISSDANTVLSSFLRGQLSVMLALGTIYTVGLWLVGIELSLLIGMGAGIISFVPYLGTIVGLIGGVIAAVVQFGDVNHVVYVLIVFGVGQLLEGFVLTPWLVGDRIGLHPVAVIFAVLAGGQLFGFVGVLLGLPLAAVIMVLLRHGHEKYMESKLYGREQDFSLTSQADKVAAKENSEGPYKS